MNILQFKSGHTVADSNIAMLRPVYTAKSDTVVGVVAGEEAIDSPEASVFLETTTSVHVSWYLTLAGTHAAEPAPVAEPTTSRRRRSTVATPAAASNEILVGRYTTVVSRTSVPLLETREFADLESYEDPKQPDVDYQALAHRYVSAIDALHKRIRASRADADLIPSGDPGVAPATTNPQNDHQRLEDRINSLSELLSLVGVTGALPIVDDDDNILRMDGILELEDTLRRLGIDLSADDFEELRMLPLVEASITSLRTSDFLSQDPEDYENDMSDRVADPAPAPAPQASKPQLVG